MNTTINYILGVNWEDKIINNIIKFLQSLKLPEDNINNFNTMLLNIFGEIGWLEPISLDPNYLRVKINNIVVSELYNFKKTLMLDNHYLNFLTAMSQPNLTRKEAEQRSVSRNNTDTTTINETHTTNKNNLTTSEANNIVNNNTISYNNNQLDINLNSNLNIGEIGANIDNETVNDKANNIVASQAVENENITREYTEQGDYFDKLAQVLDKYNNDFFIKIRARLYREVVYFAYI